MPLSTNRSRDHAVASVMLKWWVLAYSASTPAIAGHDSDESRGTLRRLDTRATGAGSVTSGDVEAGPGVGGGGSCLVLSHRWCPPTSTWGSFRASTARAKLPAPNQPLAFTPGP